MVHIVMKPGSVIPAHRHDGMAEALYVMEGDFINEGKEYLPGTSVTSRPASSMVHTPPRMGARCWCFGRTKPRRAKPTSVISRSPSTPDLAALRFKGCQTGGQWRWRGRSEARLCGRGHPRSAFGWDLTRLSADQLAESIGLPPHFRVRNKRDFGSNRI